MKLQRYRMTGPWMKAHPEGQWVEHDDAAARIAALEAQVKALTEELEVYCLRLAGALIASEGGNGQPDGAIEAIRTCPTIASVMQLRKERDAQAEAVHLLGAAVQRAWYSNDFVRQANAFSAAFNNPIARAAVEGGNREE